MLDHVTKYTDLPARGLLAAIFLISGIGKISAFAGTQAYMEAFGVPGILLAPTIGFEILAGLALLAGFQTRLVALALAGFSVASALIFHTDFSQAGQDVHFLKNLAIAGGLLALAKTGAPGLSIDGLRATARS